MDRLIVAIAPEENADVLVDHWEAAGYVVMSDVITTETALDKRELVSLVIALALKVWRATVKANKGEDKEPEPIDAEDMIGKQPLLKAKAEK